MSREPQLTIIAAGTTIRGDIQSEDDLTIEGRVDGSVAARGVVIISETGEVVSNVSAADVIVQGSLEGDILASSSVEIASGGRVEGDIKAARVILSEGAVFRGTIDMGGGSERPRKALAPQRSSRGTSAPEPSRHAGHERHPERPRRVVQPQVAPLHHSQPALVHSSVLPPRANQVPDPGPPAPLRAPDPKVRGVGRTQAFKK